MKIKQILTRKQTLVFEQILKGKRNREIAKVLELTEKGVKYHKTNIFKIYGVANTEALINKHAAIVAEGWS